VVLLKKWYISASEPGHLGVGQNDGDATKLFSLLPSGCFWKTTGCFYDNVLTFSVDGGTLKYKLDNGGSTFFNASYLSVGGGTGSNDACLIYNTGGLKTVALSPSESVVMGNPNRLTQTRGTMNFLMEDLWGTMLDKVLMKFCQLQINMTVRFYKRTIQV
jgi:hypothetical protein